MKIKLIIGILFLSCGAFAEMPSFIGHAEFNNKPYRDSIYDFLVLKSSNCIYRTIIEKKNYTVVPPTASAYYTLDLLAHFPLSKITDTIEIKTKIKNVRDNPKTIKMKIGSYVSHNDEPLPKPDTIEEWISK